MNPWDQKMFTIHEKKKEKKLALNRDEVKIVY